MRWVSRHSICSAVSLTGLQKKLSWFIEWPSCRAGATRHFKYQIRWVFVVHLNNSNISYVERQKWRSTSRCTTSTFLLTYAARHHPRIANPADCWWSGKKNIRDCMKLKRPSDLLWVTLYIWAAHSEPAGLMRPLSRVFKPLPWVLFSSPGVCWQRESGVLYMKRSVGFRSALAYRADHSLASTQNAEFRQVLYQDAPKSV
jgi:hypothetical protein